MSCFGSKKRLFHEFLSYCLTIYFEIFWFAWEFYELNFSDEVDIPLLLKLQRKISFWEMIRREKILTRSKTFTSNFKIFHLKTL